MQKLTLAIDMPEDFHFMSITMPPEGAEFAAAREVRGVICVESSLQPDRALFVGHLSVGEMSCGLRDSKRAYMKVFPDQGTKEASCLSAWVLVCLSHSERLAFDMSVTIKASLSPGALIKGQTESNPRVGRKRVQLVLMV